MRGCAGGAGAGRSPRGGGGPQPAPTRQLRHGEAMAETKQHRAGGPKYPRGNYAFLTRARDALAVFQGASEPSSCWARGSGRGAGTAAPGVVPSALAHPRGHLVPYPLPSCPILYPRVFARSLDRGEAGAAQPSCQTHRTTTAGRIPGVPRARTRGDSVARGHAVTPHLPGGTVAPSPCGPRPWRQRRG